MKKTVSVVGSGLGGLSSAIRLARMGFNVRLFEKNDNLGGKMGESFNNGFRFDTGPSLLTMPLVVDELFHFVGRERASHLTFHPVDPICRYFYNDGLKFDAFSKSENILEEISKKFPRDVQAFKKFMKYSEKIYQLTSDVFLFTPIHEREKIFNKNNLNLLLSIFKIDPFRTMHQAISKYFFDPRLVQLFDRYATYNGSNPFKAPATLNIIPYVEFVLGAFYIKGGMYRLVDKLEELALDLGVGIYKSTPVEKICYTQNTIREIQINGEKFHTDYVVSNADVTETYQRLIDGLKYRKTKIKNLEPSLSGMVFLWGIDTQFSELKHHNIFFSQDYQKEFFQIFDDLQAPDDPTVYISISSKADPDHAPNSGENWFVLINMPYLTETQDWDKIKTRMRQTIFKKLKKMNIDIESHIVTETVLTPLDFQEKFGSNRGSIYGISSNSRLSAFKRYPNRSRDIEGLYFASGSVHPGGGIPLVLLSGKMTADLIAEKEGMNITDIAKNTYRLNVNQINLSEQTV